MVASPSALRYRHGQDLHVEQEALIIDIRSVEREFLLPAERIVTVDLRSADKAQAYILAAMTQARRSRDANATSSPTRRVIWSMP